ncbi:lipase domain-containing protein, putative [Eimeria brunetti]|uniref:Lipase domain-containing protein, putative n=1 Tax=Eimeria brunetti TaxID=51314 RepID=U6LHG5_9EIME|nr:lipase domain-containing protein, putative [Eimeria brunetti]
MLQPGGSRSCRVFPRPFMPHCGIFCSFIVCIFAFLPSGSPQEHIEPVRSASDPHVVPSGHVAAAATAAVPHAVSAEHDTEASDSHPAAPVLPPPTTDDAGQGNASTSKSTTAGKSDDDLSSNSVLRGSVPAVPVSQVSESPLHQVNQHSSVSQFAPMTVTIVVGAGETVRDCAAELPSQSFLMSVARRFQQLQLLPLLAAFGQQSMKVVTNRVHSSAPLVAAAPRLLQTDSLLLFRDTLTRERPQQTMLVEVASRTPMIPQFVWQNGVGFKARSAAVQPNRALWSNKLFAPSRPPRLMERAGSESQPLFVPQRIQSNVLEGLQEKPRSNEPQGAAPPLGGSFLGGILQSLEGSPIRLNLGDMACAALPTSALNRKLSCWLLGAFTERILCRTAWYDPCQAISEETAHGKPPLSPVVLPPGGPDTLALPLKSLLHPTRGIPRRISKYVIAEEGPTYQLLWQSLTRLDDIWALAYCGRELPPGNPGAAAANRQRVADEEQRRSLQQQNLEHPQPGADRGGGEEKGNDEEQIQTQLPPPFSPWDGASLPGLRGTPPLSLWNVGRVKKPVSTSAGESPEGELTQAQQARTGPLASPFRPPQSPHPQFPGGNEAATGAKHTSAGPSTSHSPAGSEGKPTLAPGSPQVLPAGVPHLQGQDLLPGWRTELVLKALSPGVGNRTNVLAVAGRRGTDVLIAFRGTKTQVEWILNGQAEHAFNWLGEGEGRTAAGFSHIFSAAWPALQVYLASVDRPEAPLSRIIVTGYSLGGAVAALMAYGIALNYPTKVDAVIFGAPRTGDSAFTAAWAKRVNGRNIAFTLDPIPRTPCKEMPACDKPGTRGPLTLPQNFLRLATHSPRRNGASGRTESTTTTNGYGDFHGLVSFGPDELGGSTRSRISPIYVSYNHICSYPCWLATKFNPGERRTLCQLPDFASQWDPALTPDTCPALLS